MKIEWEEKRTYREEIDIQDIMEYMEDNDYHISTPMFARTIVKAWLYNYGNYSLDEYPENVIEQVAEMLLKTIEEQKITLEDINLLIEDYEIKIKKYASNRGTTKAEIYGAKQKIIDTIEKYKNQEWRKCRFFFVYLGISAIIDNSALTIIKNYDII